MCQTFEHDTKLLITTNLKGLDFMFSTGHQPHSVFALLETLRTIGFLGLIRAK